MSDVPDDRCGFEMFAGDISKFEISNSDSLSESLESSRLAVCWRETIEGSERCIWHTDGVDKSGVELPEVDHDGPIVLDGAKLSSAEFREEQLFADVRMRFADLSDADLKKSTYRESK